MARLTFANVPTASGGVASGNISTGAGSPFGKGGRFEAQVADIKATIAKAPEGTYDPQFWDQFLELDPEEFPEGFGDQFIPSDDPEILSELYKIPSVVNALNKLAYVPECVKRGRCSQAQKQAINKEKKEHNTTVALHVNRLMMKKNAPLIKALEEQQRQKEIAQAVQLAMEQKIRETATATPEAEPTPTPSTPAVTTSPTSYLPLVAVGIIIVVILIILRRRA